MKIAPSMSNDLQQTYDSPVNRAVVEAVGKSPGRILDLGCGTGSNGRALTQFATSSVGITWSPEEAALASRVFDEVHTFDLEQGIPDVLQGPVDTIVASHVLEHLREPSTLLRALQRVMTPSSQLIVALPNLLNYRYRWELLRGRFEYQDNGVLDRTHYRFFTFESATRLLRESGFEVVDRWAEGSLPMGPLRPLAGRLSKPIDAMASKAFPGLFGGQLLYRARLSAR